MLALWWQHSIRAGMPPLQSIVLLPILLGVKKDRRLLAGFDIAMSRIDCVNWWIYEAFGTLGRDLEVAEQCLDVASIVGLN